MNQSVVEKFIAQGAAFVPINAPDRGDVVQAYFTDGSHSLVNVQVNTFLKHVLDYFGYDVLSLRRRYGRVIGKQKLVPLPLSRRWTLVPANTRQAIGRQTQTGWLVLSQIREISEVTPALTDIALTHWTIRVYHSRTFILQQCRHAQHVEMAFQQIHTAPQLCREESLPYFFP